ncbi:MAG TPA: hypothetical protein VI215_10475 [Bacteroidota bacterium]|jgi:hypothetical protein
MRHVFIKTSFCLLLLALLPSTRARAQESYAYDWELSQLRGTWEYRTFRDKWSLEFECDHKMFFDREPADYSLVPGAIRIQDGNGSTDYPYTISAEGLTLTLPDGSQRIYKNTDPGEAEKGVFGTMYGPKNGSSPRENISFDGDHLFVYHSLQNGGSAGQADANGNSGLLETRGVYRVEGDVVVLAFYDSTTIEAKAHFRDEDGSIKSILIGDRLFANEEPVASSSSVSPVQNPGAYSSPPPDILVPVYVPQAPPAYSISTRPAAQPAATPAKTDRGAGKPKETQREFGTSRGKSDGR